MAASKKLDSRSPIPSRPTNPNSRNSETSNPMRRSFSGSPFVKPSIISNQRGGGGGGFNPNTPVNTPSGLISFLFFFLFWRLINDYYIFIGFCFIFSIIELGSVFILIFI
jgi:hypothetical protein